MLLVCHQHETNYSECWFWQPSRTRAPHLWGADADMAVQQVIAHLNCLNVVQEQALERGENTVELECLSCRSQSRTTLHQLRTTYKGYTSTGWKSGGQHASHKIQAKYTGHTQQPCLTCANTQHCMPTRKDFNPAIVLPGDLSKRQILTEAGITPFQMPASSLHCRLGFTHQKCS